MSILRGSQRTNNYHLFHTAVTHALHRGGEMEVLKRTGHGSGLDLSDFRLSIPSG
jgi:hypothetical protein